MENLRRFLGTEFLLECLVPAVVVLAAAFIGGRILRSLLRKFLRKVPNSDVTIEKLFSSVAAWFVYIIGVIAALNYLGVNTSGILAALGAIGLAVGLALRDTLGNIASGLLIIFLRPFKAGDFIECGSISGTVKEIGLFSTTLSRPDGIAVSSPNSSLWGAPVLNYTTNPFRRIDIPVGISYSDNIDTALKTLIQLASSDSRVQAEPAPAAMVSSLSESSVDITLRVWTRKEDFWNVKFDLTRMAKESIISAGLSIPFPQRSLIIKQEAAVGQSLPGISKDEYKTGNA